jgi:hypothetical protein
MKVKNVRSSETSVKFSLTSRRHIDEEISLHNILFSLRQTDFLGHGNGSDEAAKLMREISSFRKNILKNKPSKNPKAGGIYPSWTALQHRTFPVRT